MSYEKNAVGLGGITGGAKYPVKKKVVFVATLPPNYVVLCVVLCMFTPRRSCSLRLRLR